ncbi:MAG TPA: AAA family ATPase [Gaiellales bacterium]|nr:AAA family ATPase [Gaiellales bacterium]
MLLGRSEPLGRIEELFDHARRGDSGAVVVVGEAGVGKSTLLEHACSNAEGFTVLRCRGFESETELAFGSLGELLRPLSDGLGDLPDAQRSALAGALALGPPVAADPVTVCVAALNLLASTGDEQPRLAVVDDAQWLDRASVGVVTFLAHHLQAEGVALLIGVRSGDGAFDPRGMDVIELEGLDRSAAAELARRSGVEPAVAERLADVTGGNPLALLELAAELTDEQRTGAEPLPEPVPVIGWAQHVFGRRIEGLPQQTRRALVIAAAAGGEDMLLLGRALAADGLTASDLEPAELAGLVSLQPGRFRFHHPLVASAAYHLASGPEVRSAHSAVAAAMVAEEDADARAWHRASAAIEPDASIAADMERAARGAAERGGHATAAKALHRAAMLAPEPAERVRLLLDAADAAHRGGSMPIAAAYVDEAESVGAQGEEIARAEMLRGRAEARMGSTARAVELMLSASRRLLTSEPHAAVHIMVEAVDPSIRAGHPAEAHAIAEEAARIAEPIGGAAVDYAQVAVAASSVFVGDAERGSQLVTEVADRVLARPDARHDLQLRAYVGMTLAFAEEWIRARQVLGELIADCERAAPAMLPYPLVSLAWLERGTGDWAAAVTNLEVAIRRSAEGGRANDECWAHSIIGWIRAAQGRSDQMEAHAARQLELDAQLGLPYQAMTTDAARGLLALGEGDAAAAAGHLGATLERKRELGYCDATTHPIVAADLVEALVRCGDAATAGPIAAELAQQATRPTARALAARSSALLEDDTGLFEQAAELHELAGDRFGLARTRLLHAERLRREGQRRAARELLEQARETFAELGAAPWLARTDSEDGRSARSLRPADVARDELTESEHQVASLAVQGLQNREIAGRLFMSVKTVEAHLTRIYRKIGVRTRVELVHSYRPQAGAETV